LIDTRDVLGTKYFVTMEPHDAVPLDLWGIQHNSVIPPLAHCVLYYELRFKISQSGPFGTGVYTSSAPNEAYRYSKGAIILTKVVLGNVYNAKARHEVMSCPPGYNSVVLNRQNGGLQVDKTTVVYTNDAIRPVFLITF